MTRLDAFIAAPKLRAADLAPDVLAEYVGTLSRAVLYDSLHTMRHPIPA